MKEPKLALSPDLVKLIAEIDEFKGRWQVLDSLSPERLSALRKVATVESVGSSTRIEGAKLTDAQVETLLSNLDHMAFLSRDEQEVAGYAQAMDLVFEAFLDMRLTENHIRQLHQTLLRHSDKDERHRGSYKTLDNHVVAFDAEGREIGVVFETATPFDTPREMQELVAWAVKAIDEEALHPLLIVAIFVVVFLAIHPFQDGNGRLSRILQLCCCCARAMATSPMRRSKVSSRPTRTCTTRRCGARSPPLNPMCRTGSRGPAFSSAVSKSKKIIWRLVWNAKRPQVQMTLSFLSCL